MKKIVFTHGGRNPYDKDRPALVTMYQHGEDRHALFSVCYGLQMDTELTYAMAAQKLGEAILHDLACNGVISNEGC